MEERGRQNFLVINDLAAMKRRALAAEAKLASVREKLERYGKHDGLCARIGGYGYCSCGLEEALSLLGEE